MAHRRVVRDGRAIERAPRRAARGVLYETPTLGFGKGVHLVGSHLGRKRVSWFGVLFALWQFGVHVLWFLFFLGLGSWFVFVSFVGFFDSLMFSGTKS